MALLEFDEVHDIQFIQITLGVPCLRYILIIIPQSKKLKCLPSLLFQNNICQNHMNLRDPGTSKIATMAAQA